MKKNDLVSIVVPCYNGEKSIQKCLESLISQTYKKIEIIVVDDGSKDNSKQVITKIMKKSKNIKYYYKENGGLSSARNYGISKSTGKYITFVDSDDYVSTEYIIKLYDAIVNNNCKISVCEVKRIYNDRETINHMDNNIIDSCRYPAAWNKMYKKELFDNILFPEGKWYEDLGTTPKLTMTNKYAIVNEPLYYYIQNPSSIMHTYDKRIFDIYDIVEDLETYLKKNKEYEKNYHKIEFINIYHLLIGTIYRSSFMENFKTEDIKKIYNYVKEKYPNWHKNKYIKNLPFAYKTFYKVLRFKMFGIIYILLKLFNKKLHL